MTTRREQKEGEKEYNDLTAVSVSVSEERYCGQLINGWYMYSMQKHSS